MGQPFGSDAPRQKAVAIKQEAENGPTRLIAKGQGALAEQIIQTAFDRGIKVRSDADLTEILEAVDVDSEIPLAALAAVAEILSYIYRNNAAPETTP
ncbi:EscU/YscU/HrcU family type III secretion system export apparatus switch protein [Rhodovibrionaceae bacterium A322]